MAIVKDAFSVEKVNKEFYIKIAQFYYRLIGKNGCDREILLPSLNEHDNKTYEEFAVRLIGRSIFCWFLKHKKSVNGLSLIPKSILSSEAIKHGADYYHSTLEKLFFEVLNTPLDQRNKDILPDADKIPFLNGGLFEPHENDFYKPSLINVLKIPDKWFTDFFTLLEQYNFTIDENSTVDADVSVDPEMLGRIFENLIAEVNPETGESARKATGSYYTPRILVDYMVDQSLKQYLLTKTKIDEDRVNALLSYEVPEVTLSDSEKVSIISALDEIKIIDPACGSGAFPMGIMHKMLLVLKKVDPDLRIWVDKRLERIPDDLFKEEIKNKLERDNLEYVRKLLIIRNSIFGIDIQQIAVEISKLRVFLSLIVDEQIDDEEENRGIKSLPNLEFKFLAANSLLGLPKPEIDRTALIDFEDRESIEALARIRENYFSSFGEDKFKVEKEFIEVQKKMFKFYLQYMTHEQRRLDGTIKKLKTINKTATQMLSEWEPFSNKRCEWFDPKWMFGLEAGFDIVIANPPYIEFKKMSDSDKAVYKFYSTATGKYDIYVLFIELSKKILNPKGTLCFINPTTFMKKDYGVGLRKFITQNLSVRHIQDFGDIQAFENVTNYTGIFVLSNHLAQDYQFECHKYKNIGRDISYSEFSESLYSAKAFKDIITINSNMLGSNSWNLQTSQANIILDKVRNNSRALSLYVTEIFEGIASGKDEVFYINQDVVTKHNIEKNIVFQLLKGRDIKAFVLEWSGSYVIYPYDKNSRAYTENEMKKLFPNALRYLISKRKLLVGREYFDKSSKQWFELWNQRKFENFRRLRIVTPEISDKNNFAITDTFFGNTKTYHIILRDNRQEQYLAFLGLLNSNLMDYVYKLITTPHAGGFYAYKSQFLNLLPINDKFSDYEERMVDQVRLILKAKQSNPDADISPQETIINKMVYKLYGLTPEEIAVVEGDANKVNKADIVTTPEISPTEEVESDDQDENTEEEPQVEIILIKDKETSGTWRYKEQKEDHPLTIYLTKEQVQELGNPKSIKVTDPQQLFVTEDVTDRLKEFANGLETRIAEMLAVIDSDECPETAIGRHCNDPYSCLLQEECWKHLPEHHVMTLYSGKKLGEDLLEQGILDISNIPEEIKLNYKQQIQKDCLICGQPHIDSGEIKNFLKGLKYPLYFMDFETFTTAIPIYDGTSPYLNIPFQFSLHVITKPGAMVEHYEFLAEGKDDPRPAFLAELKQDIGPKGSILVYYAAFEKSRLKELAGAFPEYQEWVKSINGRIVDLNMPFRDFSYYHPQQLGSSSLKHVLPVLTKLSYTDMDIGEGNTASLKFMEAAFGIISDAERQKIRIDLLRVPKKSCLSLKKMSSGKLLSLNYF